MVYVLVAFFVRLIKNAQSDDITIRRALQILQKSKEEMAMFEGIGRIGAYTAQQRLRLEAKSKIKNGRSLKDMKADLDRSMREALAPKAKKASMSDSTKISIIRQKLRQGHKLSASELKFLKDTDERLYEKAKKAEEAREELQHALKHAKSKEEARRALVQAQMKVAAEAQLDAKGAGGNVSFGGGGAEGITGIEAGPMGAVNEAASFDGTSEAVSNQPDGAQVAGNLNATPQGTENPSAAESSGATSNDTNQENDGTAREDSTLKDREDNKNGSIKDAALDNESKSSGELPGEKYLFMLAAIQDEWKKFVHSKEYDELPEWALQMEEEKHNSHKPRYQQEKTAADNVISYRTQPKDLLPGDLLDLRVSKEE